MGNRFIPTRLIFIIMGSYSALVVIRYFDRSSTRLDEDMSFDLAGAAGPYVGKTDTISYNEFERDDAGSSTTKQPEETIHIAIICGGEKTFGDATRLIRSILSHRTRGIKLHLIVDNVTKPLLVDYFSNSKLQVQYYAVDDLLKYFSWIPVTHEAKFSYSLIKLALVKVLQVDRVLALDTDIIVGYDIADLWSHFNNFSDVQCIGMAEEQPPWYLGSGHWPAKGRGFNSGVVLHYLARMRRNGWTNMWKNVATRELRTRGKTELGDQDILNAAIKVFPHLIYVLPCEWNIQLVYGLGTSEEVCGKTLVNRKAKALHNNGVEDQKPQRNNYVETYFSSRKINE